MSFPMITTCPVCSKQLQVTRLQCKHCHTTIENEFQLSKLASLAKEQLHFIETFLTCRGNIKEVEKALGISYPTVRGKLDEIIAALGHSPQKKQEVVNKKEIISLLEKGELSPEEAVKMLKKE
ncbi:DUF2089 domain-containing protein [Desmospora activa]|uniref:DUF2089 domain-containing protein n=1 Tax=Desmospora activa DSM 45169 TaxID=1121389 RepID=A0A2T4Z3J2_9BACL|nr:DUF2089 domain-containing protein [Desmospora activa]PTM56457.1 hypothetical protein C8J48_2779 [Desmospora activa DSM 45169]